MKTTIFLHMSNREHVHKTLQLSTHDQWMALRQSDVETFFRPEILDRFSLESDAGHSFIYVPVQPLPLQEDFGPVQASELHALRRALAIVMYSPTLSAAKDTLRTVVLMAEHASEKANGES